MKIHAIQTGLVTIKSAQVEGRGHGRSRRFAAIFTDREWTEWLPTYAWAIEHREGVIVVDTGPGAHLLQTGSSSILSFGGKLNFKSILKRKSDPNYVASASRRAT